MQYLVTIKRWSDARPAHEMCAFRATAVDIAKRMLDDTRAEEFVSLSIVTVPAPMPAAPPHPTPEGDPFADDDDLPMPCTSCEGRGILIEGGRTRCVDCNGTGIGK
jgi:hypothetical protein